MLPHKCHAIRLIFLPQADMPNMDLVNILKGISLEWIKKTNIIWMAKHTIIKQIQYPPPNSGIFFDSSY